MQPTRSMFGHGGGGWDLTLFSRMKISSFDFVLFSLRFVDAKASTWDISPSRELEFAAGTTNLKM